jgi:hypothetical protein
MNPLSRRDRRFAELLESTSSSTAALDPAMGSLVGLATALRAAGAATAAAPEPEFRDALRQRLVAIATVQADDPSTAAEVASVNAHAGARYRARQRLAALAGTVALATSVAGVGVASARSLPGAPFYDVKRATESVQLWVTGGNLAKGRRHLEFARTRLAEARALSPNSSHIASTLAAMDSQTKQGASELLEVARATSSTVPLSDLQTFTTEQYYGLISLAQRLPVAQRLAASKSFILIGTLSRQVDAVAHGRCITCTPGSSPAPVPGISSTHPTPTSPPTSAGGGQHSTPSVSGSTAPSVGSLSPTAKPRPTVSTVIPLPTVTRITPLPGLSTLLHPHHSKGPKAPPSPLPDLSSVLGGAGL